MLVSIIPLFDEDIAVRAYSLFVQKKNYFLNPNLLGGAQFDGAGHVDGLEVIDNMGMETLSNDAEVFVQVSNISVFSDIENQCDAPHERVVLLLDNTVLPSDMYLDRLKALRKSGYKLAIRKLEVSQFEDYREVLQLMDYILLNQRKIDISKAKIYFQSLFPNIKLCAVGVDSMETFEKLKAAGGYSLYEGEFFRIPGNRSEHEVSPLKVNYIQLLNMVNSPEFELTEAADIIGRDTALVISLLKMVNRMTRNSTITSIRHAAAMLGEKELRKWLITAVAGQLYTDKPNELTRMSLLRAKFAENLAPVFSMAIQSSELFLMGLFSVLDVILDMPMKDALETIRVSKNISDALVYHKGIFAFPLEFILQYENANWQEVSRLMIVHNIEMQPVYDAYLNALRWYRDTIFADTDSQTAEEKPEE
ncbi:MAG: HDOD domain-containing protein [Lachnospiraceae bacterium]|jgi:c-di-GMP-related signal transduction protein|nr:HDOD domain-containing protein [Lachnospiraceae bacterium]CDA67820.1 hDOD domain protein [Clostridium sp. CAG:510]